MKPPSTPAVETGIVDVIEEPASGAIVVTEAEATEVREPRPAPSSRRVETRHAEIGRIIRFGGTRPSQLDSRYVGCGAAIIGISFAHRWRLV